MAENSDVRVCIVVSTELAFQKSIRDPLGKKIRRNDIVLRFNPETRELSQLDGYGSSFVGLAPEFGRNVTEADLHRILGSKLDDLENGRGYIWLEQDEWNDLRQEIRRSNQNRDLEATIDALENAQRKNAGTLAGDAAILFDALRVAISAFNPKNKREFLAILSDVRKTFNSEVSDIRSFAESIANALMKAEYVEPLDSLDDPYYQDTDAIIEEQGGEVQGITYDFANQPEGWGRSTDGISNTGRTERVRLIDSGSDRELILTMAHQRGMGGHDLGGADLVYDTRSHRSIVFVQYKELSASDTVQPSRIDRNQLEDLLSWCPVNKCHNCIDGKYVDHVRMRLNNCPSFYKLLSKGATLNNRESQVPGLYIQACLLEQLMDTSSIKEINSRSVPDEMFYGLLGRTQIGSNADQYDNLRNRIIQFRKDILLYAAERKRQSSPKQKRSRNRQGVGAF